MKLDGIILLHVNARPHTANLVRDKLQRFGWETLQNPPYSPDVSPCDFHIFWRSAERYSWTSVSGFHLHHDTAKLGYSVVKESTGQWNGAVLSSVMRVDSVCMRVVNVNVYGVRVDLVSVNFRSAFTQDTQAPPRLSCVWGHHLQLAVTFGVSPG